MEIEIVLHQMVQLFIMMALGYLLYKVRLMDEAFNKKLTKLLLNCTLPAMIMASVFEQSSERNMMVVLEVFAVSIAIYIFLPVISFIIVKLMRFPKEQQGLYMFMLTYSNVGFMGFPIISSMYGSTGIFYAAITNVVFNLTIFTLGVIQMNYGTKHEGGRLIDFKQLLTPGVSMSVLAIIVYLINIQMPADIVNVCTSVGNITTPLAMLLIGATLASMDIKSIFNDWHVYPFAIVRQIILPVFMWIILKLIIKDELISGVMCILMLLPIANMAVLFATLYGKDEKLAAKTIFITTVMSMFTVPGIIYLFSN